MSRTPLVLPILLTIMLLSGCTSLDTLRFSAEASVDAMKSSMDTKLKAQPAAGAGYVPMQQLAKNPKLPFDKAWIKQGVDWNRYRTIYIAPVNTEYLMRANWWQESIRADQMQQDVQNMATFMRTQFITAFQNDPQPPLAGGDVPGERLSDPGNGDYGVGPQQGVAQCPKDRRSLWLGAGRRRPWKGARTPRARWPSKPGSRTPIPARPVAMFADREYATVRPIDLKGFTWYGNAEDIVEQWAKQFVEIANRRPGEIIKPASTFSLKPW